MALAGLTHARDHHQWRRQMQRGGTSSLERGAWSLELVAWSWVVLGAWCSTVTAHSRSSRWLQQTTKERGEVARGHAIMNNATCGMFEAVPDWHGQPLSGALILLLRLSPPTSCRSSPKSASPSTPYTVPSTTASRTLAPAALLLWGMQVASSVLQLLTHPSLQDLVFVDWMPLSLLLATVDLDLSPVESF